MFDGWTVGVCSKFVFLVVGASEDEKSNKVENDNESEDRVCEVGVMINKVSCL